MPCYCIGHIDTPEYSSITSVYYDTKTQLWYGGNVGKSIINPEKEDVFSIRVVDWYVNVNGQIRKIIPDRRIARLCNLMT